MGDKPNRPRRFGERSGGRLGFLLTDRTWICHTEINFIGIPERCRYFSDWSRNDLYTFLHELGHAHYGHERSSQDGFGVRYQEGLAWQYAADCLKKNFTQKCGDMQLIKLKRFHRARNGIVMLKRFLETLSTKNKNTYLLLKTLELKPKM